MNRKKKLLAILLISALIGGIIPALSGTSSAQSSFPQVTSVKYGYDGNGVIYKLNSYPAYPTTQHNCRVCTVALIITTIDGVVKLTIAGCATSCRIVIGSKEFWDQGHKRTDYIANGILVDRKAYI